MSLLSANAANLFINKMNIFLISTLGSNCVVHILNNSSSVFKWYSSGNACIVQSMIYPYDITSLDETTISCIFGKTLDLYVSNDTPSRLDNLVIFSPIVTFKSNLSLSLLLFSLEPYILIHNLFISVKFLMMTSIASSIFPPSPSYSLPVSGSLSLHIFKK